MRDHVSQQACEDSSTLRYQFRDQGFAAIIFRHCLILASRNMHTGVDGGAVMEPMNDLLAVLSTFHDASGKVVIPG